MYKRWHTTQPTSTLTLLPRMPAPQLPERGHNKQGRHDLRQLGLALIVDQTTQLPLAHVLYEGARSDMKTFAAFLKPIRHRWQQWNPESQPLTLIFDAGASSKENLEMLDRNQDHSPATGGDS